MNRSLILSITTVLLLAACCPKARDASSAGTRPDIYPDYTGVTIPTGIAPLDFTIKGADALDVILTTPDGQTLKSRGKSSTKFPIKKWAKLTMSMGAMIQTFLAVLMFIFAPQLFMS